MGGSRARRPAAKRTWKEDVMKASVIWDHGLSFTGTADSGFTVNLGTDPSFGGDDDGLRPMELMLIALAGCTAMDVISLLRKKRQVVTAFQVKVQAQRAADHPKVFTDVTLHYIVRGFHVDAAAVARAIELSENAYCPAQAMLAPTVPIHHSYEVVEEAEYNQVIVAAV
jgi:putative redox protein